MFSTDPTVARTRCSVSSRTCLRSCVLRAAVESLYVVLVASVRGAPKKWRKEGWEGGGIRERKVQKEQKSAFQPEGEIRSDKIDLS